MRFQADSVEQWIRAEVATVFLGNAEKNLALTICNVPGTSDHYLEWNDQSNACANAIKLIRLSGEELQIQLQTEAAKQLGETEFSIGLQCEDKIVDEISERLAIILGDRFEVKKAATPRKPAAAPKKDYSQIKYLNLEGKNLKALPDYVQEMAALETAKLAYNPKLDFDAVCETLSKLPSVKQLTFTTDEPIPDSIGKLSQLESLSLDGMTKPQALPESMGQLRKLNDLLIMSSSDVILPESFAELAELEGLYMRVESWQLPSQFCRLSKLNQLDFSNCRLHQVPDEMAGMAAVTKVIFGSPEQRDYAQVLPVVARMPNVKTLEFGMNQVPKEIGLCRQIEELIIWTGFGSQAPLQLPDELFELDQLKILVLNMNRFAEVPEGISLLKGLDQLVFSESDFESLPASVGELSNLTYLNISENPSLRSLPESLGKLTKLKMLYLLDNPQLMRLPDGLRDLKNLEQVSISNRETIANIPDEWNSLFI